MMGNQEQLWGLLQKVIHKELMNSKEGATNLEQLDYIILTMLIDYRAKNFTDHNHLKSNISQANLDILSIELDQALEYNRDQLEQIKRLFKR